MGKQQTGDRIELVYGSLDMLILRTLLWGPTHGHGIAKSIERMWRMPLRWSTGRFTPRCSDCSRKAGFRANGASPKTTSEPSTTASQRRGDGNCWPKRRVGSALCGRSLACCGRRDNGLPIFDCRLSIEEERMKLSASPSRAEPALECGGLTPPFSQNNPWLADAAAPAKAVAALPHSKGANLRSAHRHPQGVPLQELKADG